MPREPQEWAARVAAAGRSIYDPPLPGLQWPDALLQARLADRLSGLRLAYALRRRAGVARTEVVAALGYRPPDAWRRVRPRIPAEDLEVVVMKANNVQLWNDDLTAGRRYAFLRVDDLDRVVAVRVVRSGDLLPLGSGRLTGAKRQARVPAGPAGSGTCSAIDTEAVAPLLGPVGLVPGGPALAPPRPGSVLPVRALHARVVGVVGASLPNYGAGQERRTGDAAHQLVARSLGLVVGDGGRCPDIPAQLCEVKLAWRNTLNLGAADPTDVTPRLELPAGLSYADLRYVIVRATPGPAGGLRVAGVTTVTGAEFTDHFTMMSGRNSKRQFTLPPDFWHGGTETPLLARS